MVWQKEIYSLTGTDTTIHCPTYTASTSQVTIGIAGPDIQDDIPPGCWNGTVGYSSSGQCYSSHKTQANTSCQKFTAGRVICLIKCYVKLFFIFARSFCAISLSLTLIVFVGGIQFNTGMKHIRNVIFLLLWYQRPAGGLCSNKHNYIYCLSIGLWNQNNENMTFLIHFIPYPEYVVMFVWPYAIKY